MRSVPSSRRHILVVSDLGNGVLGRLGIMGENVFGELLCGEADQSGLFLTAFQILGCLIVRIKPAAGYFSSTNKHRQSYLFMALLFCSITEGC